jgi:phosphoribosyl 1,2-cyclic phosphodiesterase
MIIRLLGTRGSVPVSNQQTRKYGGNTTCLYLKAGSGDSIIIDAGTGIRELGPSLLRNRVHKIHLIFTHYHWDHMQGLPFFAPIFQKDTVLNIYGPKKEVTVKKALSYQMTKPYFPTITWADVPSKIVYKPINNKLRIGGIKIQTIVNNHPNYTLGLKFIENNSSVAFLTDNELFTKDGPTPYKKFVNFVKNVDLLIHDAQYSDQIYEFKIGWGHSTPSQVMKLVHDANVKEVLFTHHDPYSSDKFIDTVVKDLSKKFPRVNVKAAADGKTLTFK